MKDQLSQLLEQSSAHHRHLCPRQVLGVRMGLLAGQLLGLELPQNKKRLLTIVETDGCFADGVAVATNCWVGRRTMRVEDLGKVAATFVDTHTETAVRLFPTLNVREIAPLFATEAKNRWQSYLIGYQRLPDNLLLGVAWVQLNPPVGTLISRAGVRVSCDQCGEEVINGREIILYGRPLCRTCATGSYYTTTAHHFLNGHTHNFCDEAEVNEVERYLAQP
jgi:formylmethanofuran dehydrogenase subunit E